MVLEATMILLDNSEWMRNGDYTPTRLSAQNDAVHLVFNAKRQQHPENTCGVLTSAGRSPEVLLTLTTEEGRVLTALHGVQPNGTVHFSNALQVATLALKHRQNKNQHQRIVAFVGSPVEEEEQSLVKLAKKLKKSGVAVDIVAFGEASTCTALQAFIDAVSSNDNSHFLSVPAGGHLLSDAIVSSPILLGEDGAPPAGFATGGDGFEFGVDPSLDPELALALRISLEEERARQNAESGNTAVNNAANEDPELARAMALSMGAGATDGDVNMGDASEDAELQRALAMSMEQSQLSGTQQAEAMLQDPQFLSRVLGQLPGVDPNDPRVRPAQDKQQPGAKPPSPKK